MAGPEERRQGDGGGTQPGDHPDGQDPWCGSRPQHHESHQGNGQPDVPHAVEPRRPSSRPPGAACQQGPPCHQLYGSHGWTTRVVDPPGPAQGAPRPPSPPVSSAAAAGRPTARAHVAGAGPLHGVSALVAVGGVALLGPGDWTVRPARSRRGRRERPRRRRCTCVDHHGDRRVHRSASTTPHRRRGRLLHAGQRRLHALRGGQDAELGPLLVGQVVDGQPAEDVVDQDWWRCAARGRRSCRPARSACWCTCLT